MYEGDISAIRFTIEVFVRMIEEQYKKSAAIIGIYYPGTCGDHVLGRYQKQNDQKYGD
jgi:hypothetical protein